ncbi:hypothetical protein GGF37_000348 [Kickxella alabastrina]|nr:hypothetical protein GGF37_000348 [Kickxella alabastrina]
MQSKKLTLSVVLQPPLPDRKFFIVFTQNTILELKAEIIRRFSKMINSPITLTLGGYELMDEDLACDLLSNKSAICVHLANEDEEDDNEDDDSEEEEEEANIKMGCKPRLVKISKRVHGDARGDARPSLCKMLPVQVAYENACSASDALSDGSSDSDSGSSSDTDSSDSDSDSSSNNDSSDSSSSGDEKINILGFTASDLDALPDQNIQLHHSHFKTIAYKELEISSDMSPQVSTYRIGQVMRVDNGVLSICVLRVLEQDKGQESQHVSKRTFARRENLLGKDEVMDDGEVMVKKLHVDCLVSVKILGNSVV